MSKKHSAQAITELYQLGHREFAENYYQELAEKAQELAHLEELRWSFIGQLQSNKIKKIVEIVDEIHTVGKLSHGQKISVAARESGRAPFPIYLSLNLASEAQKGGLSETELTAVYDQLKTDDGLNIQGLMCIPPRDLAVNATPRERQEAYGRLRHLANQIGLGKLSLGMSRDLACAITAGSDCLRIGTAIFGSRS